MDKACTRCGLKEPSVVFQRDATRPDGLRSECRPCNLAMRGLKGLRLSVQHFLYPPEEWLARNVARLREIVDGKYRDTYLRGVALVHGAEKARHLRRAAA